MGHQKSEFYKLALGDTLVPIALGGASQVAFSLDPASAKGARVTNINNPDTDQYYVINGPDANAFTAPLVLNVCDERLYVRGNGGAAYLDVWIITGGMY